MYIQIIYILAIAVMKKVFLMSMVILFSFPNTNCQVYKIEVILEKKFHYI